ncbi:MAG: hypothetical protein M3315_14930 [Actinomycetota bacterium]|nr:hypothetical protein [Actinomycetota bacterium]
MSEYVQFASAMILFMVILIVSYYLVVFDDSVRRRVAGREEARGRVRNGPRKRT